MKKRIIIFAGFILIGFIIGLGINLFSNYKKEKEAKISAQIQKDTSAFITRAQDEFNSTNLKASDISRRIVEDFNSNIKNPYDKKLQAYTFDKNCASCSNVEAFDSENTIIITTYNSKGKLEARTIIKPTSFVTYSK